MRPNKLRELLKSNKPTLSTHIHTTWPSVVEAIGHTGLYDYVEFVGEYGPCPEAGTHEGGGPS